MHLHLKMDISQIISNTYIKIFGVAIFAIGFNIFYFLEKIKNKVSQIEDKIIESINDKYKNNNLKAQDVIYVHNTLTKRKSDLSTIKNSIDTNLWSGIGFLVGSIIGFISNMLVLSDELAIMILFTAGVLFTISFIQLFYWYIKKS